MTHPFDHTFSLYPSDSDEELIQALLMAQNDVFHIVKRRLSENHMEREKCFDEFIDVERLSVLKPFGKIADFVLRNAAERAHDEYHTPNSEFDDDPFRELGFSVPGYYLSFFFDEVTSISFGEIGPIPTDLHVEVTQRFKELMVLDNSGQRTGVLVSDVDFGA